MLGGYCSLRDGSAPNSIAVGALQGGMQTRGSGTSSDFIA